MSDDPLQNGAKSWRKWNAKAWLSDTELRLCTVAARGLWIDMLNIMMVSPMCGYLVGSDKKSMPVGDLANIARLPVDETEKLLKELKDRRVYSVDRAGRIFSRRMVREENLEKIGREAAKEGIKNRERNQDGTLRPWRGPGAHPGVQPPAREKRIENRKKEGRNGDGPSLFGSQASRGAAGTSEPWTLEQKRNFGHTKVAEALGQGGWEIVMDAVDGKKDALKICKAKAKEIGVTWYSGKPNIKPVT